MRIKYSPVKWNPYSNIKAFPDTEIIPINENSISIDGELYEFDTDSVVFPDINSQTQGAILDAGRNDAGEIALTVRRFYTLTCHPWDTGDYHEVVW